MHTARHAIHLMWLLVLVALALAPLRRQHWVGGFDDALYMYKFTEQNGNPLRGVRLRVTDVRGNLAFCYPVTNYTDGGQAIESDDEGKLSFFHINMSPEFTGMTRSSLFGLEWTINAAPEYIIEFIHEGQVILKVDYVELDDMARASAITSTVQTKGLPDGFVIQRPSNLMYRNIPEEFVAKVVSQKCLVPK